MNVLEKIDDLHLYASEYDCDTLLEIARLAKLGAAAEKAIEKCEKHNRHFTSTVCRSVPVLVCDEICGTRCEWQDFCRLRKENQNV